VSVIVKKKVASCFFDESQAAQHVDHPKITNYKQCCDLGKYCTHYKNMYVLHN